MAKRIPGVSKEWSNYLLCLLLHMSLPLLPLGFETLVRSDHLPSIQTLNITAAFYAISIGLSSKNVAMFGLGIFVSICFSVVFGIVSSNPNSDPNLNFNDNLYFYSPIACIVAIFVIHACERYNRHVADCTPFFEF
ncbi:TPA: hypothetical protein KZS50_000468 [Escherichia coli]|nr:MULTISPECIES: hypothetical protein [Escherichia]MCZ8761292.1 hypothetical protein [Escherichia albertii]HBN4082641.1 hypothetical protein [Escherichia coli O25b:H4-ST131]EFC4085598.1 hypothetical protein [Escherichia coli]EFH2503567.1 hypothetical protein [Escherichia coli]EHJ7950568.1 hypothetical protein [Escherichia coli]